MVINSRRANRKEWQDLSYKALVKPLSMAEQQRLVELSMDISKFITNKFYEAVELLEGARGKSDKYLEWALTQLEKEREDRFEVYEELDLMRIFITCDDKLSKEFEEFKRKWRKKKRNEIGNFKTVAVDITHSVFNNDTSVMMYVTSDIYSDKLYYFSTGIFFSSSVRETHTEMDYEWIYDNFPSIRGDYRERLIQEIKRIISEF